MVMGAMKQVFRKDATERNRRKFYQLCDKMDLDQALLEPPTTVNGGDRCGLSMHLETMEYHEIVAIGAYFQICRAGVSRLALRIGMAAIVDKMTELWPEEEEGDQGAKEESHTESAAV